MRVYFTPDLNGEKEPSYSYNFMLMECLRVCVVIFCRILNIGYRQVLALAGDTFEFHYSCFKIHEKK